MLVSKFGLKKSTAEKAGSESKMALISNATYSALAGSKTSRLASMELILELVQP